MTKQAEEFSKLYEQERKKIDSILQKVLQPRKPESLYEPGAYILKSGGKRLRPLLVLFSTKAAGGNISESYNAAVAVELLHNFTLVHDDIMDNADKRRGIETLHKKYDSNTAILVGDSLLAVAYECLLKDCKKNSEKIFASFTKALVRVCEGQSFDKEFETKADVTPDEYISMISKKTAALFEMCCEIGGLLGKGSEKTVKSLMLYGRYLGIAFQIHDDLLDITGDEKKFGKIVGGDLVEGKKTYLFIRALQKAGKKERSELLKIVKNKGIEKKNVKKYQKIYFDLGIIDDSVKKIKEYSNLAMNQLKILDHSEREMFSWLTGSLIDRSC